MEFGRLFYEKNKIVNKLHFMDDNKIIDFISWMDFISSWDFMNFHGWTSIPLGWCHIHINHRNDLEKHVIWSQNLLIFSQFVFKIIYRVFSILKVLLSSFKDPWSQKNNEDRKGGKGKGGALGSLCERQWTLQFGKIAKWHFGIGNLRIGQWQSWNLTYWSWQTEKVNLAKISK